MRLVSAQFSISSQLREHIAVRSRSFAMVVIPSLMIAREEGKNFELHLGFHDPRVLANDDPIVLVKFDDGFELLVLQEDLLERLDGTNLSIKRGVLAIS